MVYLVPTAFLMLLVKDQIDFISTFLHFNKGEILSLEKRLVFCKVTQVSAETK